MVSARFSSSRVRWSEDAGANAYGGWRKGRVDGKIRGPVVAADAGPTGEVRYGAVELLPRRWSGGGLAGQIMTKSSPSVFLTSSFAELRRSHVSSRDGWDLQWEWQE